MGVPRPAPVAPADALLLLRRGRVGRGLERLRLLEDYLRTLVARVSRSPVLTDFLAPHALDLEPALPPGRCLTCPQLHGGAGKGL